MKFDILITAVNVEMSVAELRAITRMIGPTSQNSRIEAGMSELNSRLLSKVYDEITDFFDGERIKYKGEA